jgi:predicted phage gp36 major capsid-like protein
MGRSDLERLSKEELIELVLRLQRPPKTSRTSSKPPSTDRKQQRERSKPGGANPVTKATAGSSAPRRTRWSSTVLTGARAAQPS